jgi:ADP-ribose pyrophosphatase
MNCPRIVSRKRTVVSPWVTLVEKEVCLREGAPYETYHSVSQDAYVSVFAMTRDQRIPLIRQYRPAVEDYTWEFPAGTVDPGESAAAAAGRELLEETGLHAESLEPLGDYYPDTGRLSVESTAFFAICSEHPEPPPAETALEVRYVTLPMLLGMVRSGEFRHQMHVALIASALVRGHITLPKTSDR